MDSAELLDLLGNDNRRRILRLLAEKPCYVTEICEYLDVSPKAVIDHLEKLETAGLIESRVDDQRRKYYYISQNLRLEVQLSPYGYGAKSAYPASSRLDITSWQYLSIDIDTGVPDRAESEGGTEVADEAENSEDTEGADRTESTERNEHVESVADVEVKDLADELNRLESLERELSMAQRWTQGRVTDVMEELSQQFEDEDARIYASILNTLSEQPTDVETISRELDIPTLIVSEALEELHRRGAVRREDDRWRLTE
jgi:ArsR family transcriptional regulator